MKREAEVDFAIVGTGAGGATAARVLTEAGLRVVLLEEGPRLTSEERPLAVRAAMRLSFRDGGMQSTFGKSPLPILQGRLVGGSTAINSGIIWRLPEDVRQIWVTEHGLGELLDRRGLEATFEQLERELHIEETPADVRGQNATLMEQAAQALHLEGRTIRRNVKECAGSARCLQGCPRGARQSMDVSYVPFAEARGALVWPLARVDRIEVVRGRAVGVCGRLLDGDSRRPRGRFHVHAKRGVIVAAGAIHTPLLLRRAGLRGLVGERLQAHPGSAVVARFEQSVNQGFGATQGYEVPMRERGYKLESLSIPPELLAARLPGIGSAWQARVSELDHYAHWVTQVRMQAQGSVRASVIGPRIRYRPTALDFGRLRESLATLVRMFFAAGASEVFPGVHGLPAVFTRPEQAASIESATLFPERVHMLASHLFGTACAGSDEQRSVVGPRLETHAITALYVMDASVFPSNLGVNPQHSIMALAFRAAERLA